MNQKEVIEEVYGKIMNPELVEGKTTYTEKQVASIATAVATMVGDPAPSQNAELYKRVLEDLKLPKTLENYIMEKIISARRALKFVMMMKSLEKNFTPEKAKELLGLLNGD